MPAYAFSQVDVFGTRGLDGNPLAVVHAAEGLDDAQLQRFARWTGLSETAFLLPPTTEEADYRVRIFTIEEELPFAGHPTLGSAYAWLRAGGQSRSNARIVQECGAGLVRVRRTPDGLAFASPPLIRSGPVDEEDVEHVASVLGIARAEIVDAAWAANGPGWVGVLLGSAEEVLALRPGFVDLDVGVAGLHPDGVLEVRAFFPKDGSTVEDPVTGSLNASLAEWLIGSGRLSAPYLAHQGTALGRAGRVHVTQDAEAGIWVAGGTVTCVSGILLR
jgi:PhzF family phenazine biosynthesis protein